MRLRGPNRDAELKRRLPSLDVPTLVLFGTLDGVIPPQMGHLYKELMPNCHLVFVYDAVVSLIILKLVDIFIGLRVTDEVEREGLDLALHGETVH